MIQYCRLFFLKLTSLSLLLASILFFVSTSWAVEADQCSIIGNNTARWFGYGGETINEAQYMLASYDGANMTEIANAIRDSSQTMIVRLGAGGGNIGTENPNEYIQHIKDINNQVGGKEFVVMVSHNEWNCAEHPTDITGQEGYDREKAFTQAVVAGLNPLDNLTLITGQVDHLCSYTLYPPTDKKSPIEYINMFKQIPGIDGISLPFYVGDGAGDSEAAIAAFSGAYTAASGKQIWITESGPFQAGSGNPDVNEIKDYVIGLQKLIDTYNPTAILLFNALGLNRDPNFQYTSMFWDLPCREALRNSCNDVETVLEVCQGLAAAAPVCEEPHSCKCFCKTDNPDDPCQLSRGNDCSFPFEASKFLSTETDPETIANSQIYLAQYLRRVSVSKGVTFALDADCQDCDVCKNPPDLTIQNVCEQASGEASTTITVDNNVRVLAPSRSQDLWQRRTQSPASFLGARTTLENAFNSGPNPRTESSAQYWRTMASLQNLKNECYNRGLVIGWVPYNFNNKEMEVRCVNYIEFQCSPFCPNGMNTERDVFKGPLEVCVNAPGSKQCDTAYANLHPTLRREYVDLLPIYPIATFPIIGATDRYVPDDETSVRSLDNEYAETYSELTSGDDYNSLCEGAGDCGDNTEQQIHKTSYYVYLLVTGQHAFLEALSANNKNMSAPFVDAQDFTIGSPSILDSISSIVRFLLTFNGRTENPFWWTHIPQELYPSEENGFDFRFASINLFLNDPIYINRCMSNPTELDVTTEDIPIDTYSNGNILSQFLFNLISTSTKLFTFFNQPTINPDDFEVDRYIACEILPQFLTESDELMEQFAKTRASQGFGQSEDMNKYVDRETPYRKISAELDGQVAPPEETCSTDPGNLQTWRECASPAVACPVGLEKPCCSLEPTFGPIPGCVLDINVSKINYGTDEDAVTNRDDGCSNDNIGCTETSGNNIQTEFVGDGMSWLKDGGVFYSTKALLSKPQASSKCKTWNHFLTNYENCRDNN